LTPSNKRHIKEQSVTKNIFWKRFEVNENKDLKYLVNFKTWVSYEDHTSVAAKVRNLII
jgi:hypothetical protein